jgi:hypothetical protein
VHLSRNLLGRRRLSLTISAARTCSGQARSQHKSEQRTPQPHHLDCYRCEEESAEFTPRGTLLASAYRFVWVRWRWLAILVVGTARGLRLEEEGVGVKGFLVVAAAVVCALVFSSAAFANSVKCAHGTSCGPGSAGAGTGAGNGTLPFTGLGLGGIATVGGLLLVSGVVLAQSGSRRKN